ncbi:phage portal protein [Frateuria terrea]|uniref:Phage portal protein, HK97 family n=1 Tax=Frateuria terrea TaxID=529704 RepID=A0A1H6ZR01_9GAMM|nr:phage portal protein [Frateuria terrea]SEJ55859.1 phage portal protein, HK97 family [Frateuria terrea]SFP46902.1 phage portal protein, HK97 family [Frateuria terrea]
MPRIPEGAKTTDLAPVANAARQQGFLGRLSTAVRYAIAGVSPDTWMSPNQPVQPVAQGAAGRQFDYPVGVNLTYTPRGTELTSFQQLRALADRCDLVRLAIETRKDQMSAMVWSVGGVDDAKDTEGDTRVQTITALLKRPDGVHSWQSWLRMVLEEVMVTDATSIYVRRRNNGEMYGFELIDGTTIKPLVDDTGRRPAPPSPAYQQVLKGIPAVDYTADELVYTPRNPRVHKFYGFSPVEQIILTVNIALRRMASQLQYFTEGNIPAAYASMPQDWSGEQIKQFQAYWDSVIEGDQGYKRKVRFVPGGTKVESVKDAPLKDEFDEWLARVVCYAFSLPPTAFIKQQNRSTSETQQEAALKEGLTPIMVWVKEVMDHLIQVHLGCPDLQFKWVEEESLDPAAQATILTTYQSHGAYTINEIRAKLGEKRITEPGGDAYLIFTASGAVPLEQVMAPPPAPVDPANPDEPPPRGGKPAPKPGDKAEKHADGDLNKAAEPLTNGEMELRDAFAAALDVVKQNAIKALKKLGKTAADGTRGGDNGTSPQDAWIAEYISELDTSGLSLAWDDYVDAITATAADGAKHEVARLIVTEPEVLTESPEAVATIFGGKDPDAIKWASEHAVEMLTKDGQGGKLAEATREMVRQTLTDALQADASHTGLADLLETAYAFSPERAELIATTELRDAEGKGAYVGATAVGMKAKHWLLSNDEGICVPCQRNAKQGWIPIDQPFQSGDAAPIAHPHCRCDAAYKRKLPEN